MGGNYKVGLTDTNGHRFLHLGSLISIFFQNFPKCHSKPSSVPLLLLLPSSLTLRCRPPPRPPATLWVITPPISHPLPLSRSLLIVLSFFATLTLLLQPSLSHRLSYSFCPSFIFCHPYPLHLPWSPDLPPSTSAIRSLIHIAAPLPLHRMLHPPITLRHELSPDCLSSMSRTSAPSWLRRELPFHCRSSACRTTGLLPLHREPHPQFPTPNLPLMVYHMD